MQLRQLQRQMLVSDPCVAASAVGSLSPLLQEEFVCVVEQHFIARIETGRWRLVMRSRTAPGVRKPLEPRGNVFVPA
jgi:hypothetical protein